jgi:hypothetical protein
VLGAALLACSGPGGGEDAGTGGATDAGTCVAQASCSASGTQVQLHELHPPLQNPQACATFQACYDCLATACCAQAARCAADEGCRRIAACAAISPAQSEACRQLRAQQPDASVGLYAGLEGCASAGSCGCSLVR